MPNTLWQSTHNSSSINDVANPSTPNYLFRYKKSKHVENQ